MFHDLLPSHSVASYWSLMSPTGLLHSHTTNQGWNPNRSCECLSFTQTLSSIYNTRPTFCKYKSNTSFKTAQMPTPLRSPACPSSLMKSLHLWRALALYFCVMRGLHFTYTPYWTVHWGQRLSLKILTPQHMTECLAQKKDLTKKGKWVGKWVDWISTAHSPLESSNDITEISQRDLG